MSNKIGRGDYLDLEPDFTPTKTLLVYVGLTKDKQGSDAISFNICQDRFNEGTATAEEVYERIAQMDKGRHEGEPFDMKFSKGKYEVIFHIAPDNWKLSGNVILFKDSTPNKHKDFCGLEWYAPEVAAQYGYDQTATIRLFNKNSVAGTYAFSFVVDVIQTLAGGTEMITPLLIDPEGENDGKDGGGE